MARDDRPSERTGAPAGDTGLEAPAYYRILILDDGGPPPDLIEGLLKSIFHKQQPDARRLARDLQQGVRVECGVHRFDVAETKACEAIDYAAARDVEIQMTLETV